MTTVNRPKDISQSWGKKLNRGTDSVDLTGIRRRHR